MATVMMMMTVIMMKMTTEHKEIMMKMTTEHKEIMMKMMTEHKEIGELSNSRYLFIVTGDFCN